MTDQELKESIQEIKNSTLPIPTQQKIIDELKGSRWIPIDEKHPQNDTYILVSFENFNMPDIARYEEDESGGTFYPGDEEKNYKSFGLIVNAWRPLPDTYKKDDDVTNRRNKKCRECVHTRASCHHRELKCSECPLTELFCDEFYVAIDRCYEDAYASGCLAGIETGKYEALREKHYIVNRLEEEKEYAFADFEEYVNEFSPWLYAECDDLFHRGLERAIEIVNSKGR